MQSVGIQDTLISRVHGHSQLETDYAHCLSPQEAAMADATCKVSRAF